MEEERMKPSHWLSIISAPSFLGHYWLDDRKDIWPVQNLNEGLHDKLFVLISVLQQHFF